MQFKEIVNLAVALWKINEVSTPLCILGQPGIGKSAVAPVIAREMTKYVQAKSALTPPAMCTIIDLSSRLPEDIGGIPFRGTITFGNGDPITVAEYGVQKWLAYLCQPGVYGVLLFDDLPAAAPSVQVAVRQLLLDRMVGENKLSEGIAILVTGNRREDKSAASTLPAHVRNSLMIIELDTDLDSWADWYGAQPGHAPVVAAFLRYRPLFHSRLPKDADKLGAFATPRTWAKLGRVYETAHNLTLTYPVATGLVGEGPATEFLAFVNVRSQLVDPASVLRDPIKAMPDPRASLASADRAYAMATGLGEVAAAWRKSSDKELNSIAGLAFLRAVGHVTSGSREHISTAVSTYTSNGGNINDLVTAGRANLKDPLVLGVVQFLAQTFGGK